MKKALPFVLSVILICCPALLQAQSKTFPENLEPFPIKKLIELGAHSIKDYPCYGPEGDLLSNRAAMKMSRDNDYRSEYFADASGNLAAIRFRKITEAEKERLESYKAQKAALKALIGTEAKDFTAITLEGEPVDLSQLKGSVVAINFWFIGCKPCIQEIPELNEIVSEHEGDNIRFIAIALDGDEAIKSFLDKRSFDYEIVTKGRSIAKLYGVSGYPTHCIVDQEGKIVYLKSGYGTRTAAELKKTITKLLDN